MQPLLLAAAAAVGLAGAAAAQSAALPCFEPDFGTLLGSADDTVFPAVALGSPFPAFGTVHTHVEVSSNGFVWLGALGNPDAGAGPATGAGLASGAARVCALWTDLATDGVDGSGVYHATKPGRDVFTWVRAFESYDPTVRFTLQLQLTVQGEAAVWFHPATTIALAPHSGVCGLSPGNTTAPVGLDFSASPQQSSNTDPTVYEEWSTGTFDLAARTYDLAPNGLGGWSLRERVTCSFQPGAWSTYGAGCPLPSGISGASFYELTNGSALDLSFLEFELVPTAVGYDVHAVTGTFFPGYTNVVPMQDDQVVDQVLPFAFTNPGGTCTTAGFCSNGFVWLDNFNNSAPAAPYVPALLAEGPRLAALWTDLDLTAGGTAYFDATPTAAYFTWVDAPDFHAPSQRSTFQIQLHSDGRARLCYGAVAIGPSRPALAGYGVGGATHDPGSIDLSASVPFQSGTGVLPVQLDAARAAPVLGQPLPLVVSNLRPSAAVGVLVLGLTQFAPGVSLAGLGMPNCFAHTSLDATFAFVATPPATQLSLLTMPADPAYVGFALFAQAAVLDPGLTPFGLAASNGGAMVLGFF